MSLWTDCSCMTTSLPLRSSMEVPSAASHLVGATRLMMSSARLPASTSTSGAVSSKAIGPPIIAPPPPDAVDMMSSGPGKFVMLWVRSRMS